MSVCCHPANLRFLRHFEALGDKYTKVVTSLKRYPLPINGASDAMYLEGVGKLAACEFERVLQKTRVSAYAVDFDLHLEMWRNMVLRRIQDLQQGKRVKYSSLSFENISSGTGKVPPSSPSIMNPIERSSPLQAYTFPEREERSIMSLTPPRRPSLSFPNSISNSLTTPRRPNVAATKMTLRRIHSGPNLDRSVTTSAIPLRERLRMKIEEKGGGNQIDILKKIANSPSTAHVAEDTSKVCEKNHCDQKQEVEEMSTPIKDHALSPSQSLKRPRIARKYVDENTTQESSSEQKRAKIVALSEKTQKAEEVRDNFEPSEEDFRPCTMLELEERKIPCQDMGEELVLLIDTRETKLFDGLGKQKNIKVEERALPVGDICWIWRNKNDGGEFLAGMVVERKTLDDLSSSIQDGRYSEQKGRVVRLFDSCENVGCDSDSESNPNKNSPRRSPASPFRMAYLVEGVPNKKAHFWSDSRIGRNFGSAYSLPLPTLASACVSTQYVSGFHLIRSLSAIHSAKSLGQIHHALVATRPRWIFNYEDFVYLGKKTSLERLTAKDMLGKMLRQVPNCGAEAVESLLEHVNSLKEMHELFRTTSDDAIRELTRGKNRKLNSTLIATIRKVFV